MGRVAACRVGRPGAGATRESIGRPGSIARRRAHAGVVPPSVCRVGRPGSIVRRCAHAGPRTIRNRRPGTIVRRRAHAGPRTAVRGYGRPADGSAWLASHQKHLHVQDDIKGSVVMGWCASVCSAPMRGQPARVIGRSPVATHGSAWAGMCITPDDHSGAPIPDHARGGGMCITPDARPGAPD